MPSYQKEATEILRLFLGKIASKEEAAFLLLADNWQTVSNGFEAQITRLLEKQAAEGLTENQLFRLAIYQKFEKEAQEKILAYSKIAGVVVSDSQKYAGKLGIQSTETMISIKTNFFQKLNVNAIDAFVGKSFYTGNKLDTTLFARSYPDYMEKTKNLLLQGISQGKGAKEIAKDISKNSTAPLWESMRLARTESMSLFRNVAEMSMRESGVVKAMERIESPDCCSVCEPLNHKIYRFGETQDDYHPNCRGTVIPVL